MTIAGSDGTLLSSRQHPRCDLNFTACPRGLLRSEQHLQNVPPPFWGDAELLSTLNRGHQVLQFLGERIQSVHLDRLVSAITIDGDPVRGRVEPQHTVRAAPFDL